MKRKSIVITSLGTIAALFLGYELLTLPKSKEIEKEVSAVCSEMVEEKSDKEESPVAENETSPVAEEGTSSSLAVEGEATSSSENPLSEETSLAETSVATQGGFRPYEMRQLRGPYLNLEGLFWFSNMGSLAFGTTSESTTSVQNGKVISPSFEGKGGYRVGLGYKLPHDRWDLISNYTYVYGSAHKRAGGDGKVIFPVWATQFGQNSALYANEAKAKWRVHLNMGDLELGRSCFPAKWLSLRPFVGLRGGTIDQTYQVSYEGGTLAPSDQDQVKMTNDFWGIGMRMGVNTLWGIGNSGLSIYGNGSTSLLSGHFTVHEREKMIWQELQKMNLESQVSNVVVEADVALGLQWDYVFSNERYHIGLKMGWEFDIYFNQNQLFHFTSTNPGSLQTQSDDLSFQGLTVGFRFDF